MWWEPGQKPVVREVVDPSRGIYYSYFDKWAWFSYQIAFYISMLMFTE